jgi:hypothetical protein
MGGIDLTAILQIILTLVITIIGFFIKDKFKKLEEADADSKCRITAIEKSFSDFKEKMPLMYTTREDQLRAQASLESRVEKIGTSMEQGFDKINAKMDYKLDGFFKDVDQKISKFNDHLNEHISKKEE